MEFYGRLTLWQVVKIKNRIFLTQFSALNYLKIIKEISMSEYITGNEDLVR